MNTITYNKINVYYREEGAYLPMTQYVSDDFNDVSPHATYYDVTMTVGEHRLERSGLEYTEIQELVTQAVQIHPGAKWLFAWDYRP